VRGGALDLREDEPPEWLKLASEKIMVRWAEAVVREAASP
jgi:hypothetical protein